MDREAVTEQSAESAHMLARDNRGWFCLNCEWPGGNFTQDQRQAQAHLSEVNL